METLSWYTECLTQCLGMFGFNARRLTPLPPANSRPRFVLMLLFCADFSFLRWLLPALLMIGLSSTCLSLGSLQCKHLRCKVKRQSSYSKFWEIPSYGVFLRALCELVSYPDPEQGDSTNKTQQVCMKGPCRGVKMVAWPCTSSPA